MMLSSDIRTDAPDLGGDPWSRDPWEAYTCWREAGDVRWSPAHRSYFVFGHESVRAALRSPALRSDYVFRATRQALGPSIVDLDGEDHARLRPLTTARLGTHHLERDAAEWLDALVADRITAFAAQGGGDAVGDLAIPVVTAIITRVLGLPQTDAAWLYELLRPINRFLDTSAGTLADADLAREELERYLRAALRPSQLQETGALALLARAAAADDMTEDEAVHAGLLLLAAGTETSIGTIATAIDCLCVHQHIQDRLRAGRLEPSRFVREVLRWEPPMHFAIRYAANAVVIDDIEIPEGALVQVCLASANRDPAVFRDPALFDPDRPVRKILTFGYGRHGCPGSGLAQSEATAVVRQLMTATRSVSRRNVPVSASGRMFRRPVALPVEIS